MLIESKLTTIDNPFDPFEQFKEWNLFDIEKGYYSCSRLMRIAVITDDMSEEEKEIAIDHAIDEIIKYDITNTYKKVTRVLKDEDEA